MQAERIPDVFGFEAGRGRGDAAQRADQAIASRDFSALVLFRIGTSGGALGYRSSLVSSGGRNNPPAERIQSKAIPR
jgi:hypothetical protein